MQASCPALSSQALAWNERTHPVIYLPQSKRSLHWHCWIRNSLDSSQYPPLHCWCCSIQLREVCSKRHRRVGLAGSYSLHFVWREHSQSPVSDIMTRMHIFTAPSKLALSSEPLTWRKPHFPVTSWKAQSFISFHWQMHMPLVVLSLQPIHVNEQLKFEMQIIVIPLSGTLIPLIMESTLCLRFPRHFVSPQKFFSTRKTVHFPEWFAVFSSFPSSSFLSGNKQNCTQ